MNNRSLTLAAVFYFIAALPLHSQTIYVTDSLEDLLNKVRGKEKIKVLNRLAIAIRNSDQDRSLILSEEAVTMAVQLKDQEELASAFNNLGIIYANRSSYDEAVSYHTKSLEIYKKIDLKLGIADGYNNLGIIYANMGDYPKTLESFKKALEIRKEMGSKKGIAASLNNLGIIYNDLGDYPRALQYFQESLEIKQSVGYKKGIAKSFLVIGKIHNDLGDYHLALTYFQKALDINRALQNNQRGVASALNNIGIMYSAQGEYEKAINSHLMALEIRESLGNRKEIAASNINIASIYADQGKFEQAYKLYDLALEMFSKNSNKKEMSLGLQGLGSLYQREGKFEQALDCYQKSLEIIREIGFLNGEATALMNLGDLAMEKGDYQKALKHVFEAVELYEEIGEKSIAFNGYAKIAEIFNVQQKYGKAIEYYRRSLDGYQDMGYKKGVGSVLKDIGSVYHAQHKYSEALKYYHQAKSNFDSLGLRQLHVDVQVLMADLYTSQEKFDQATSIYKQALTQSLSSGNNKSLPKIYNGLANSLLNEGKVTLAIAYGKKGLSIAETIGLKEFLSSAHQTLALAYEEIDQFQESLKHFQTYSLYQDSLDNELNAKEANEILAKYETEKKDQENEALLNEAAFNRKLIRNQRIANYAIAAVLILMIGFTFYIYRAYQIKKMLSVEVLNQKEQVEESRREIEAINSTQTKWFTNIAHEIRTPLTLVLGPVKQVLNESREDLSTQAFEKLDLVNRNGEMLSRLINEMLDISKLEEARITLNPKPCDLVSLVNQCLVFYESYINQKKLKIVTALPAKLVLHVDEGQMEKVIHNLISNAIKYTNYAGRIEVTIDESSFPNESIDFTVKDTGDGILPRDLARIFDRFYQGENAGRNNLGGTGLGLALSKELAILHGGDLSATSIIGEGSEFVLSLPKDLLVSEPQITLVKRAIRHESSPKSESSIEDSKEPFSTSETCKPHVLLVDDNPDMRKYIKDMMEQDFLFTEATDGEDALNILDDLEPDLIISDLMMPRMDGIQLTTYLRQSELHQLIPIMVVTALMDEKEKLNVLRIGVDDYISKPFDSYELQARVNNLIANARSRLEAMVEFNMEIEEKPLSKVEQKIRLMEEEVRTQLEHNHFSVKDLAEFATMSERNLRRFIKTATGLTPSQFIREIKLQKALILLESNQCHTLQEVTYAAGFESAGSFSKVFEARFGKKVVSYFS